MIQAKVCLLCPLISGSYYHTECKESVPLKLDLCKFEFLVFPQFWKSLKHRMYRIGPLKTWYITNLCSLRPLISGRHFLKDCKECDLTLRSKTFAIRKFRGTYIRGIYFRSLRPIPQNLIPQMFRIIAESQKKIPRVSPITDQSQNQLFFFSWFSKNIFMRKLYLTENNVKLQT